MINWIMKHFKKENDCDHDWEILEWGRIWKRKQDEKYAEYTKYTPYDSDYWFRSVKKVCLKCKLCIDNIQQFEDRYNEQENIRINKEFNRKELAGKILKEYKEGK